jgi:hypothetical protein
MLNACTQASNRLTTQQQVLEVSGILRSGKQQSEDLPVGDIRSASITVISDQPDLLTEIRDPQGKLVASAQTSDSYLANVPTFEGAYSANMKLTTPSDGMWQIQLSARSETQYFVVVGAETSTVLDVHTDRSRYPTDSYINVDARLFREQTLLSGGTTQGELLSGSRSIQVIDLHENSEGAFQGQFAPVNEAMRPYLIVTVRNGTIQRQVEVPLVIFEPSARILGVLSEQLSDNDNNGKANQLIITVQLDVKSASSYSLASHFEDQKGEAITYAEHNTAIQAALGEGSDTLNPGRHVISLSFSGQEIHNCGVDGPYLIRLILYDVDQAGAEVDAFEYVTRVYLTSDFE